MPREIWKSIYDGCYEVSSLGRVRRIKMASGAKVGKILSVSFNKRTGRPLVGMSVNGKRINMGIHKLVAFVFLGPRPKGTEINHKNLIKYDCRDTNLEYITHKKNMEHARLNGALVKTNDVKRRISVAIKRLRARQRKDGTLKQVCTVKRYK